MITMMTMRPRRVLPAIRKIKVVDMPPDEYDGVSWNGRRTVFQILKLSKMVPLPRMCENARVIWPSGSKLPKPLWLSSLRI